MYQYECTAHISFFLSFFLSFLPSLSIHTFIIIHLCTIVNMYNIYIYSIIYIIYMLYVYSSIYISRYFDISIIFQCCHLHDTSHLTVNSVIAVSMLGQRGKGQGTVPDLGTFSLVFFEDFQHPRNSFLMHSQAKKMKKERKSKGVPQVQSTTHHLNITYRVWVKIKDLQKIGVLNHNSTHTHTLDDFRGHPGRGKCSLS